MSTDLELCKDLTKLRLPKLTIQSSNVIQEENNKDHHQNDSSSSSSECFTPTSEENKIPAVLSCPPPPRKSRKRSVSCRRKLSEFQFFEIVHRDEIDAFFKSAGFDDDNSKSKRRRCPCT